MLNVPTDHDSDHDLAVRYRDGDSAAFEELYRRHGRGLYLFVAWCAPQRGQVEQMIEDCWAAVHEARGRYLASASFCTFLYQVAHHRLFDPMRDPMRNDPPAPAPDPMPQVAPGAPLEQAVRALPDEQREALVLRQFSGLGHDAIALVCGVPQDTVETRLRDAMRTLGSRLAIDAGGEGAVSERLRSLAQPMPPPALDARLNAQARAALDHPARVAHDPVVSAPPTEADAAADDEEAPRPSNPFGHLRLPMAVAAILVIGITLALQLREAPAPDAMPANVPAPASAAAPGSAEGDPAAALERIDALLDQHRDAEARAAWHTFRRLHPDAAAPAALRARIEALPPAR